MHCPLTPGDMARCLLCLLFLAVQAAAGSLRTGLAVRFNVDGDNADVHVRDRTVEGCNLNPKQTMQLYEHDIFVVSIATDSRSCIVNSTAFPHAFDLNNDTEFAQLALEGVPVNLTAVPAPLNISLECSERSIHMNVQVTTSSQSESQFDECCDDKEPQHKWCHRCGKGQYREGLRCHPCPGGKTTPMTGVFTIDDCICPEGYGNADDKCEKCEEGKFSEIQDRMNEGCQSCNNTQLSTGPRATACPGPTPNATNTNVQPYEATQYLRPRQEKCGKECCVPGEYWDAGRERCQNCVDGYNYSATHGATTCETCGEPDEGHQNVGCFDGPGIQKACEKGYYRERNDLDWFCKSCPSRKTTQGSGKSGLEYCKCEPGYVNDGNNGCTACEEGKYQGGLGKDSCQPCPQHKTTRSQGSTRIQDCVCERGFYGGDGDAACSRCERGQYQNKLGRDECEVCEVCPYGGYATGCGGANQGRCMACVNSNCEYAADGETCDFCGICNFDREYYTSQNISNPANYANSSMDLCGVCNGNITEDRGYNGTCHKCPAGTTGEDGPRVCNATETEQSVPYENIVNAGQCRVCTKCAIGTFKSAEGKETCEKCPVGKYANVTGLTACYQCDVNKTTDAKGSTGVEYCVCDKGYKHKQGENSTGTHACQRCEPGTFNEHLNHHVCSNCSAGEYNNHDMPTSTSCEKCLWNKYSNEGAGECESCLHSFTEDIGSAGIEKCICNVGFFSASGGRGICVECVRGKYQPLAGESACIDCEAGTFSNATAAISNTTCQACDDGYTSSAGDSTCTPCSPGTFSSAATHGICEPCVQGKFTSNSAATECEGCVPGTYADGSGLSACTNCSAGWYSTVVNATSSSDCFLCAPGSYSAVAGASGCTLCARGSYAVDEGQSECTKCAYQTMPLHLFAEGDLRDEMQSAFNKEQSHEMTCNTGSTSVDLCCFDAGVRPGFKISSGGEEWNADICCSGEMIFISGGNYNLCDNYNSDTDECIFQCEYGKFKENAANATCTECDAGKYKNNAKTEACVYCPAGYYSASGASTCSSCTANSNSSEGSTSVNDCSCNPGYFGHAHEGGECTACEAGKKAPSSRALGCTPCDAGEYSDSPGATVCTNCEQGKYSTAGGASSESSCVSCENGQSSHAGSDEQSDCYDCPAGSYSHSGSTPTLVCTSCGPGTYSENPKTVYCSICKPGTYASSWGTYTRCSFCPEGKSHGNQYGSSVTQCVECTAGKYSQRSHPDQDFNSQYCLSCPDGQSSPVGSDSISDCTS